MMSLKAVIFDMDGVVSDTQKLHAEIEKGLLKEYGIEVDSKELADKYAGMSDREFYEMIFRENRKNVDIDIVIKEKWDRLIPYAKGRISAIEGAIELIKKLKNENLKLAIASSSRKEFVELVLSELKIKEYFDVITSGEEVKFGKPNPEIFLLTSKKLEIEPKECVVIEDGKFGMIGAKRCGMKCVGLVNNDEINRNEYCADKVFKNLNEITLQMIE